MIKRICASLAIILFAALGTLAAAGLDGKWKGSMSGRDGDAMDVVLVLKADGAKLTGTVTNYGEEQITEGMIKGDEVSFVVLAGGGQFKIVYKGKLAGDEIKFKVTVGEFGDRDLTATRQP